MGLPRRASFLLLLLCAVGMLFAVDHLRTPSKDPSPPGGLPRNVSRPGLGPGDRIRGSLTGPDPAGRDLTEKRLWRIGPIPVDARPEFPALRGQVVEATITDLPTIRCSACGYSSKGTRPMMIHGDMVHPSEQTESLTYPVALDSERGAKDKKVP